MRFVSCFLDLSNFPRVHSFSSGGRDPPWLRCISVRVHVAHAFHASLGKDGTGPFCHIACHII